MRAARHAIQIAFVASLIGFWYLVTATGSVNAILLPPIGKVVTALQILLQTSSFWHQVGITASTVVWAYVIAAVAGIGVGYLASLSQTINDVLEPLLSGLFAIPLTLFFPLFVIFFGIDTQSKIAYAAVYAFFPIALNAISGFSAVSELHRRAALSMGATSFEQFRYILMPAAFPVILVGMRIAFFICVSSVLSGETLASLSGIGHSITSAAELMETPRMFAWIVFVILSMVTINAVVSFYENRKRVPSR